MAQQLNTEFKEVLIFIYNWKTITLKTKEYDNQVPVPALIHQLFQMEKKVIQSIS